jgi:hypothetical protein
MPPAHIKLLLLPPAAAASGRNLRPVQVTHLPHHARIVHYPLNLLGSLRQVKIDVPFRDRT